MAKKFPKSDEVHEYTDSKSSKISKQDKFKDSTLQSNFWKTYNSQVAERHTSENSKKEAAIMYQASS